MLIELRDEHLVIAGKIKCLQSLGYLYYDLRAWIGDELLSLRELQPVRETCVSQSVAEIEGEMTYQETLALQSKIVYEHNKLRDLVRERKYRKKDCNED